MSIISNNDIAHAIYLASKDKSKEEQSLIFKNVIKFLVKKKKIARVPDILLRLGKIINNYENRIVGKIFSKEKITETQNKEINQILAHRYSVKEVILNEKIDEKLLGGFKMEVGDEVIDLTLKKKIEKLQEHLTSNK
ncbi:ATP synthase F1 subunit delta [Candidatus Nomurabacteria bacterium RIFOXYB1_FULL_39_16]|uniref:ATP synthase subunit delta n=2 Tax=Candidatus Nomuraibacteriota TaxID=1752729 RepID=A0A0G0R2E5_9BACT|nr:MAG: ATP synthase subunit delta [Candidatus Nomurabacteria bacterium GW2011_GWF2_40_12]OGJ08829.1 MAG: ATP synthase F1 subunit delta [Candidatus Nomurabacteria bacterium RIFOXYB1_FULL_39_16]OGJ14954.1 MAG: ATP synthase F1 subunit delta [Candidatus Nomurabacteria bacterium RIFOXYD1_FULL_39_12]